MAEDGRSNGPSHDQEPPDDMISTAAPRGSGLIFLLVAIALILAISFFYLTKERESDQSRVITEAAESVDSAARVVGDAAQNAADSFDRDQ